jgi:hypothetical protein
MDQQIEKASPEMFLFARNSAEMVQAQQRTIAGMKAKAELEQRRTKELEDNLEVAKKNKWRTETLKRHVGYSKERVAFYQKIILALEAGYQIIPDMDLEVFAVRTTRKKPLPGEKSSTYKWGANLDSIKTNVPPPGDGEYVAANRGVIDTDQTEKDDGKGGKTITYHKSWSEFAEPEFPFQLVKTEVLDMTAAAMQKKIFDELGVLPRTRGADPIVAGRIVLKGSSPRTSKRVNFMVAWFLDLGDL